MNKFYTAATRWQRPLAIAQINRPSTLWHYLSEQQSLTKRLRRLYADLHVQCLKEFYTMADTEDARALLLMPRQRVLVREIYLRTEKTICTYGRSIIPCTALASDALSWLKHLGEKSLGDCLNRYTVWRRQDLQMSLLTPENSEYRDATRAHPVTVPNLWARRSKLVVGKHALLVTEVFFPECFHGDRI